MHLSGLGERLFVSLMKQRKLERFAVRALLRANELLGLAVGVRLAKLRDSDEPLASVYSQAEAGAVQARLSSEVAELLCERWGRVPERRRPHYRPEQRYR